jgi:hypothetical protein
MLSSLDPLEPAGSDLLWRTLLAPFAAALGLSAAVLATTWRPWRRLPAGDRPRGAALAVAAGYLAGHVLVEGRRPFPPRERLDWLWYLVLAATLPGLLDTSRRCPVLVRAAVRAVVWLAVAWVVLPPASSTARRWMRKRGACRGRSCPWRCC